MIRSSSPLTMLLSRHTRRREFISLLGGAAAAWPLTAWAQQTDRVRRIGVLMNLTADDPEAPGRVAAFAQGLGELGWTIGRNVRIDYRWGANDPDRGRRYADELIALAPDTILASGILSATPLQRITRTLPIVFVNVTDPVTSRNWVWKFALLGFSNTAINAPVGTSSRTSPRRLPSISWAKMFIPVALPPGRLRLTTKPKLTGSSPA